MTQQLRALATLAEAPSLVPSTHVGSSQPPIAPASRELHLFQLLWALCAHTQEQKFFFFLLLFSFRA